MNLFVEETWVDATRNIRGGSSGVQESFTNDLGELYRRLQSEYGRCTGKVYIDDENGKPKPVGWVFQKRARYDDVAETYVQETWVTVHKEPPTVVHEVHCHYADFPA